MSSHTCSEPISTIGFRYHSDRTTTTVAAAPQATTPSTMSSSTASPTRSALALLVRATAVAGKPARRACSKARAIQETIGALVRFDTCSVAALGQGSASWTHNLEVLGSSPSPCIVGSTFRLDYIPLASLVSQSTTMSRSPQHSRNPTTAQVLAIGQALGNAARLASLFAPTSFSPAALTETLRSVVTRDRTTTAATSARDTTNRPFAPTDDYSFHRPRARIRRYNAHRDDRAGHGRPDSSQLTSDEPGGH